MNDAEGMSRWPRIGGTGVEKEWERAARGADGRLYPHGDRLLPDDANFDETYGKRASSLGPRRPPV